MAEERTRSRSFTGRPRRRHTSPLVRWIDRIARWVIAAGGIGTIATVSLVCVFLVYVVMPLFGRASIDAHATAFALPAEAKPPVKVGLDEYKSIGWALYPDGKLYCFRLADGRALGEPRVIKGSGSDETARMTAWSFAADSESCVFGFQDGSLQSGKIGFKTSYLKPSAVPEAIRTLKPGETAEFGSGVVSRTPEGQFRLETLDLALDSPTEAASKSPILRIAFAARSEGPLVCTNSADGKTYLRSVTKQVNPVSDEVSFEVETFALPPVDGQPRPPSQILISGQGDGVILAWDDGRLCRFDIRNPAKPRQVETIEAATSPGARLTAAEYLLGGGTLMVGDSKGTIQAWTTSKPRNAPTSDGIVLVPAHRFSLGDAAITALAVSSRDRMVAAGSADGKVRLVYVTSDRIMAEAQPGGEAIEAVAIAPRNNGLVAVNRKGVSWWKLDPAYPEISLTTLFRPVWYEGYPGPTHSWQSSSGSDSFEPKFGLWPLVFGTLKATFYSMLFGAPLALLAALYTSEFLHPRFRAQIKPTVEVMASLPSVVLGFLAGLVIAPAAESFVPAIVTSLFAVPVVLLLAAHLWQLLPIELAVRWARWRLLVILLVVPLGVVVGFVTGPTWERILFGGDLKAWLVNDRIGTGTPGWFVILLPLSALVTAWGMAKYLTPRLRRASAGWTRFRAGLVELLRFVAACVAALLLAWLAAVFLSRSPLFSLDPRGLVLGTYIQRNALIVGFMMGFAIIPLIYTIADDALSSVPTHLRSASLGCGATQWQTTLRIVIPTAMSGLFSAVMIGLGRAVGETMIVLMAAGNTPIIDWNIFNGFQTLSSTIATEMPEAPAGSTHFRTLFLAALTLFIMTFFVNSIAEVIRLRFRRRAHEL